MNVRTFSKQPHPMQMESSSDSLCQTPPALQHQYNYGAKYLEFKTHLIVNLNFVLFFVKQLVLHVV